MKDVYHVQGSFTPLAKSSILDSKSSANSCAVSRQLSKKIHTLSNYFLIFSNLIC